MVVVGAGSRVGWGLTQPRADFVDEFRVVAGA